MVNAGAANDLPTATSSGILLELFGGLRIFRDNICRNRHFVIIALACVHRSQKVSCVKSTTYRLIEG